MEPGQWRQPPLTRFHPNSYHLPFAYKSAEVHNLGSNLAHFAQSISDQAKDCSPLDDPVAYRAWVPQTDIPDQEDFFKD